MRVLFIHKNFPAQFGQVAAYLARHHGYRCFFLSEKESQNLPEIEQIVYRTTGGAREETHYCSRTFENQTWHSHAAYEAMKGRPDVKPDLIVCHSGFVSSLFLRDLYPGVPHIGYFEYFYHVEGSDMDFRRDLPLPPRIDFLRARNRNAQLLLDLEHCDAGYSPTEYQRSQLPAAFRPKVRKIFDGIDTDFWKPRVEGAARPEVIAGVPIPPTHRLVTYVSRGFEAMRGFDIFLQVASRICQARSDVTVLVVGEDRIAYGGDHRFTAGKSFKDWAIERYQPDLQRIHFVGRVSPTVLSGLLAQSDLHLYLTAPFVLSWSLMNALSCGGAILASDTPPVREVVVHGENGWLCDFFDVDGFTRTALEALDDPERSRRMGREGRRRIENEYALPICLDQMRHLYGAVCGA